MKNLTAAVKKVLSALLTAALLTALAPTLAAAVYIGTVRDCQWDKDNAFYAIGHLASGAVMENVSPYVGE